MATQVVECERIMLLLKTLVYSRQGRILSLLKIPTSELLFYFKQVNTLFFLQFFFTSFSARDRSYLSIFRLWQNVLLDKVSL